MFFSKIMPVSNGFREAVLDNISTLSSDKTLIHINFLYDERRKSVFTRNDYNRIWGNLLSKLYPDGRILKIMSPRFFSKVPMESYHDTLFSLMYKYNQSYLLNKSDILWNKMSVCYYKKSSYFRESDKSLMNEFIYDIGDSKDHKYKNLAKIYDSIADVILKNLSTEICFDLCSGVRQENNWNNTNNSDDKSKIHVLVSNWVSLYNNFKFLPPHSSLIVHVDPILLNENIFAIREDLNPIHQYKIQTITPFIKEYQNFQHVLNERLNASFDISKLIKNNHINAIRLNFNGRVYIMQSYDLEDAIAKIKRGY